MNWLRRVGLWLCYVLAARHQRRGTVPRAANPSRQAEAERVWARLLRGIMDDWQRRVR